MSPVLSSSEAQAANGEQVQVLDPISRVRPDPLHPLGRLTAAHHTDSKFESALTSRAGSLKSNRAVCPPNPLMRNPVHPKTYTRAECPPTRCLCGESIAVLVATS